MEDKKDSHYWVLPTPPAGSGLWIPLAGNLTSFGQSRYHLFPDYFCPHVIVDGHGKVFVGGKTYEVGPGDIFTLWPGNEIIYHDFPDTPWRFHYFYISGSRIEQYVQALGFSAQRQVLTPLYPEKVIAAFHLIWQTIRDKPADGQSVVLSQMFALPGLCTREMPPDHPATLVDQALMLIHTAGHPTAINVNELAGQLGVSRATLYRKFIARTGQSPITYIVNRRLELVREFLVRSGKSVDEICHLSGFSSEKYLSHQFKKRFGITLAEFRKHGMI